MTVLERAADAWESGTMGWCQGSTAKLEPGGDVSAVCAYGGIVYARFQSTGAFLGRHNVLMDEAIHAATSVLKKRIDTSQLGEWNDATATSKVEVIELFKSTAKDLRNQAKETAR